MPRSEPPAAPPGAPSTRAPGAPAWSSVVVGLAATAIYLALAPAVSGDKDASEFTLVLATAGVSHPTGYALYTMLGHLFVLALHAAGASWAYAANAWSAVGGGAAIGLLHALAARLVPAGGRLSRRGRAWLALPPVLLLAIHPLWTEEAAFAEVYSWHLAWVAGAALAFTAIVERLLAPRAPGRRGIGRLALAWGLVVGLGLAHHATSALIALPLSLVLLFAAGRALRPVHLVLGALAALVPLTSDLWLVIRPRLGGGVVWPLLSPDWPGLVAHVTAAQYRQFLGRFAPSPESLHQLVSVVYPVLLPAMLLAVIAAARAPAGWRRTVGWSLVAAAGIQTLYTFQYGVADPGSYFLPAMALSLAMLPALIAGLAPAGARRDRTVPVLAGALALVGIVLGAVWIRGALERRDGFTRFDAYLHGMWEQVPDGPAIVVWPDDMYYRLIEYQQLRGEKPAATVLNPWLLTYPGPRRAFVASHGFDPTRGLTLPAARGPIQQDPAMMRYLAGLVGNVAAGVHEPVIVFDPRSGKVFPLGQGPGSSPADSTR